MEDYIVISREGAERKQEIWYDFMQDLKAGLAVTLEYMFRKKVTMQYPYEKSTKDWEIPERWRGLHAYALKEDGSYRCIACSLCIKTCPDSCISMVVEGKGKDRVIKEFTVDLSRCSFCGMCFQICPVDAIVPTEEYEISCESKEDFVYPIDKLVENWKRSKKSKVVKPAETPAAEPAAPAPAPVKDL